MKMERLMGDNTVQELIDKEVASLKDPLIKEELTVDEVERETFLRKELERLQEIVKSGEMSGKEKLQAKVEMALIESELVIKPNERWRFRQMTTGGHVDKEVEEDRVKYWTKSEPGEANTDPFKTPGDGNFFSLP